jgi:hypothetical protein
MNPTNPESEELRLAEMYSQMSDMQLQELADDSAELSDIAVATLQVEIRRRGLTVESEEPSANNETENPELKTIRTFQDISEAFLAKGLLESAGIECFLIDTNMVRLNWFISSAIGYVKLQVRETDSEAALEILDQPAEDVAAEEEPEA